LACGGSIDDVHIHEQRVEHTTHVEELCPILVVAREACDLPGGYYADLAQADLGSQVLEAITPSSKRRG
jgi:hypothetical protein